MSEALIETALTRDGVEIVARWWLEEGEVSHSQHPREVVIRIASDASPHVVARGVTTGVTRRAEAMVAELVEHVGQTTSDGGAYWREVVNTARQLPASPRSRTGDYYGALLDLFELLDATHADPVNRLAQALADAGRPLNKLTLNKQLQRARQARPVDRPAAP